MAPGKPTRKPRYWKCTRPYCMECGPRFSSAPVKVSEVHSLENAKVPVSNVPPRAKETVSVGKSQVSTVQQTESAVSSLAAKLSTIGINQQFHYTMKPNWKSNVHAAGKKTKKDEEELVENFKKISLNESSTE